jgi:murein DD-endopeptidase MepM/ murein hydrolase activator NlpD
VGPEGAAVDPGAPVSGVVWPDLKRLFKGLILLAAAAAVAAVATSALRTGSPAALELRTDRPAIGKRTGVVASASVGGRGLAGVRLELEQGGTVHVLAQHENRPLPAWRFGGAGVGHDELQAEVGYETLPQLREGEATLRLVAERAPTWLLSPDPVVKELRLPVRRTPPTLSLLSTQNYVAQGGAAVVVYRVGASATADYVSAGDWLFPGVPLPGGTSGERVALFGVPWDMGDASTLRLVAEDDAGNSASLAFVDRFERRPPVRDRIELGDAFLRKVVPEIRERTPGLASHGGLLEDYLEINRDLREQNRRELVELARQTEPTFLFEQAFLPLPNAKVMSAFADRRTYFYAGREVDQQTHLGFDLAAVAHTLVPAPNPGVVRLARYFGIYGNAVVIDHGLGLMSLCAHLSSIDVTEGQRVERGQPLGRTGATGLAGGDHLHFTMLVRGLPVNPIEWWDGNWIRGRVFAKLPRGPGRS